MNERIMTAIKEASRLLANAFTEDMEFVVTCGKDLDSRVLDATREVGGLAVETVLHRATEHLVEQGKSTRDMVTQRRKMVLFYTVFGLIEVDSPYMWCAVDQVGWRPMKDVFGVTHRGRSRRVERAMTDFGSDESFGEAASSFGEHYGWQPGRTTVRTATLKRAQQAEEYVQSRLEEAAEDYLLPRARRPGKDEVIVELDGCEIRTGEVMTARRAGRTDLPGDAIVRQEAWREVRTGLSHAPGEVDATYVCRLDKYGPIMDQLFGAACAHGLTDRSTVIAPGDGAFGLREAIETCFADVQIILDYPHLKSHVYETAEALEMDEAIGERWVVEVLDRIWQGDVDDVLRDLRALLETNSVDRLRRLVDYLERFADAVDYAEYEDRGWPTSSGEVESAHRHIFQARLKIAGACWKVENVNPMLTLRVIKANGWWDDFWSSRRDHDAA